MAETDTKSASSVYTVVSLGGIAPGDTLQGGDTRRKIFFVGKFTKNSGKRGRTGKKVWGDTLSGGGGDNRVKAIKSDSDSDSDEEKRSSVFHENIEG